MTEWQIKRTQPEAEPIEDDLLALLADVPPERLPALLARVVSIVRENSAGAQ